MSHLDSSSSQGISLQNEKQPPRSHGHQESAVARTPSLVVSSANDIIGDQEVLRDSSLSSMVQTNTAGPPAPPGQRGAHPPSKAATGGQSHSHRPVSAMPTPVSHAQRVTNAHAGESDDILANIGGGYNDRRASAHPTVPTTSQTVQGLAQIAMSPSIDASMASNAISSGIPITSQAAMQYFAAHPRRQQVHFGNYLLLQTLGEGEFGKVKLGVHKEWGEEVAVKLIKREKVGENGQLSIGPGAPPKDPAKMSKVEREIQVLKEMRHPNIVRLYEVIESDRYIGIVLEYASGGELFDHILAHKYLKERDACRLFAQLVSGVNYLHQKKVIHRDLKLENLLLDRNRNVIITDFGFANNFANRQNDLMATSCGSPCYAAPELVVQDGLYNGSAVDVWSCGVILYAMLAGYLPFDDDPANPEGDNINLLYKYIMATPLSFPEYITAEPRDLLSRMLIPDPVSRIDLPGVMAHSWLAPYRELFKFTVEELERAAVEQQTKKRQVYRQQMEVQHQMRERQRKEAADATLCERNERTDALSRSNPGPAGLPPTSVSMASGLAPQSVKAQRHQSATATSPIYEGQTARGSAVASQAPPSRSHGPSVPFSDTTNRAYDAVAAQGEARGEPRAKRIEGEAVETLHGIELADDYRKGAAGSKPQRHTVQLEYDGGAVPPVSRREVSNTSNRSVSSSKPAKDAGAVRMPAAAPDVQPMPSESEPTSTVVSAVPVLVPEAEQITAQKARSRTSATSQARSDQQSSASSGTRTQWSTDTQQATHSSGRRQASQTKGSMDPPAPVVSQSRESRAPSNPSAFAVPATAEHHNLSQEVNSNQQTSSTDLSEKSRAKRSSVATTSPPSTNVDRANSSRRHQRGMSTDKLLSRLLGTSTTHNSATGEAGRNGSIPRPVSPSVQSVKAERTKEENRVGRSASNRRKAMSLVIGGGRGGDSASRDRERANATMPSPSRTIRQEPSKETNGHNSSVTSPANSRITDASATSRPTGDVALPSRISSRPSTQQGPPPSASSRLGASKSTIKARNEQFPERRPNDSSSTVGPSSSAAKKVMDWFRRKSLSRGSSQHEQPPLPLLQTSRRRKESVSAGPTVKSRPATASPVNVADTPKLTLTQAESEGVGSIPVTIPPPTPSEGGPSSRSTSGAYSNVSHSSAATGLTSASESSYVNVNSSMLPPATSSSKIKAQTTPTPTQQATPRASYTAPSPSATPFNDSLLRYHVGAVDQSALTSRPPKEIFAEVCRALYEMGIEARKESGEEFKLECVRRKKPTKSLMGATQGLASLRSSVFPPSQADYERHSSGLSRSPTYSGLPSNSASGAAASFGSTAMSPSQSSIRNFLRRGSQTTSPTFNHISLPESFSSIAMEQTASQQSAVSSTHRHSITGLPPTLYGETRVDGGQEVRFSVEVTRIKNLAGLYSLDVRRLRGPLTSYKFLYHNVLRRVTDPGIDQ